MSPLVTGLSNLEDIYVHPDNPYFSSVDGVLFNKDQTKLICFPMQKQIDSYTIPNTVSVIELGAFSFGWRTTELRITIPTSVKTIHQGAFHMTALLSVFIPKGVLTIERRAFITGSAGQTAYPNILCEDETKPDGWDEEWCYSNTNWIVWGYTPGA